MIQQSLAQRWLVPVLLSAMGVASFTGGCSGDDDDDTSVAAHGGTGAHAGKGGTSGKGGVSGKGGASGKGGTIGTSGKGGTTGGSPAGGKGGSAGVGGAMPAGGEAAMGADAGAFNAGTGGTSDGGRGGITGAAGEGGDAGQAGSGAESGAGGEGGMGIFRPERRDFTPERLAGLNVAPGFVVNAFATSLGNARMLAVHGEHVYVTRTEQGDVIRLQDSNDDGQSDSVTTVAQGLENVHGIAITGDQVYLATINEVMRGDIDTAGGFQNLTTIIDDLPDGGQHYRRTLGVGPDGALYISVGSSCDACAEPDPEHATLLRASLDGTTRSVFARGLRNTIGFDWHPSTNELWGMDHGSDMRGDDIPPEELNHLTQGSNYGWPYCFGARVVDPIIDDPTGTTKEAYCATTEPAVLAAQAHSAPIGLTFYAGTAFPEAYRDDAFVAFHGSWDRSVPVGYRVVRVRFEAGEPVAFEDFVSGFLIENGAAFFGRPAGITTGPDGALLFSDDINGTIYRVAAAP
jgi:glucose/arabinose dehydrogenase